MTPKSLSPTEPIRTCVGCRRRAPARQLIRFVVADGDLIDGRGRPGRGAWLCQERAVECFDQATSARAWARSLRVRIRQESLASLRSRLAGRRPNASV